VTGTETLESEADAAAANGRFAEARALLERAVKANNQNPELWTKLSAMRKAGGDFQGALAALDQSLALAPLDFSALLARAFILERLGDARANLEFGNALTQAPPDDDLPAALKQAVAHARRSWEDHRVKREERLLSALPLGLDASDRQQLERFISNHTKRTRHYHQEPTEFHYPGLPEIEFHDRTDFPELAGLESQTHKIRDEFQALIAAELAEIVPYTQYPDRVPLRQWKELNNNPRWSAIHLMQNGRVVESNARHCPLTMAALRTLPQPNVPGASPNAMFSLLAPRTRIPAHTGVANTRLVCHLPLIVPTGCAFRVGDSVREWRVGEAFVFDDTIEHEAWNDSDELRVVLIVDLWPPALSEGERQAVAAVIGAVGVSFSGA
jgi:aspartyl/asparaginyl beta-hydroxylase (cupin superfamily)